MSRTVFHVFGFQACLPKGLLDAEPEGLKPILDYQFVTEQGGKKILVQEVYLNSAEFISGSTVQLMQFTPQ